MTRKLLRAPTDPTKPTEMVDENPRQVIGAFFLALALYLGVAFGAVAQEKITLDTTQALAAAQITAVEETPEVA